MEILLPALTLAIVIFALYELSSTSRFLKERDERIAAARANAWNRILARERGELE